MTKINNSKIWLGAKQIYRIEVNLNNSLMVNCKIKKTGIKYVNLVNFKSFMHFLFLAFIKQIQTLVDMKVVTGV